MLRSASIRLLFLWHPSPPPLVASPLVAEHSRGGGRRSAVRDYSDSRRRRGGGGGGLRLPTGARYSFGPSFSENSVMHACAIVAAYAGGLLSLAFALLCVVGDGGALTDAHQGCSMVCLQGGNAEECGFVVGTHVLPSHVTRCVHSTSLNWTNSRRIDPFIFGSLSEFLHYSLSGKFVANENFSFLYKFHYLGLADFTDLPNNLNTGVLTTWLWK